MNVIFDKPSELPMPTVEEGNGQITARTAFCMSVLSFAGLGVLVYLANTGVVSSTLCTLGMIAAFGYGVVFLLIAIWKTDIGKVILCLIAFIVGTIIFVPLAMHALMMPVASVPLGALLIFLVLICRR